MFERLLSGLEDFRGADLLHVGFARSICDRSLENKLRNWGKSTPYPIPRLLVFDGAWAEPVRRGQENRFDVLDKLMEWVRPDPRRGSSDPDSDQLQREFAVWLIWLDLLSRPERFDYWSDAVWSRWPMGEEDERQCVFFLARALRSTGAVEFSPRTPTEHLVFTMFSLERAWTAGRETSVTEVNALVRCSHPSLVAGQVARTLGALVAYESIDDPEAVVARYTAPLPVLVTEPYDDRQITGFLSGLEAALSTQRREGRAPTQHGRLAQRLRELHATCSNEVDVFGRVRGAILASLVTLGHGDALAEQMSDVTSHPYELTMGCRALARELTRDPSSSGNLVERVLAVLRTRTLPWSFAVLESLAAALPDHPRWIELRRRVELAKTTASNDRLLAPKVTSAILSDGNDDYIKVAVRNNGQVPSWELWAIKDSMREPLERARRVERDVTDRAHALRGWYTSTARGQVATDEIVTFMSVLRRVHVTWFVGGRPDYGIHDLALDVIRGATELWPKLFLPGPTGNYFAHHYLNLVAEATLVLDPATSAICANALATTWRTLFRDHDHDKAPSKAMLRYWRRALVATTCCHLAPPDPQWFDESIGLDAAVLEGLAELERQLADASSNLPQVLRNELERLNALDIPLDARAATVVQLMLHNLKNRIDKGARREGVIVMVRRLRALVGGPNDPVGTLDDVLVHALELAGAVERQPAVVVEVDDLRKYQLPYVVVLLILEEMIANALEHGEPSQPIIVEAPSRSSIAAVLSHARLGQTIDDVVARVNRQRSSSASGLRFAAQVATKWGMELGAEARDGCVRVTLDNRTGASS
jgi:hypothetical protein